MLTFERHGYYGFRLEHPTFVNVYKLMIVFEVKRYLIEVEKFLCFTLK